MNQDLRQAEKLTLSEKRLLKRHSRSAIAIMAMHTLLCVVYFQFGYFDVALEKGLVMLFVVWASLVAYQLLLATGWTLRLSEPSLSLPLVLHFMVVFMWTSSGSVWSPCFLPACCWSRSGFPAR